VRAFFRRLVIRTGGLCERVGESLVIFLCLIRVDKFFIFLGSERLRKADARWLG